MGVDHRGLNTPSAYFQIPLVIRSPLVVKRKCPMENNPETKETVSAETLQNDPLCIPGLDDILAGVMREINGLRARDGQPQRYPDAVAENLNGKPDGAQSLKEAEE
ncbi:MAG: hypothetical protein K9N52_10405 [Verrucomicrobia bacterium]|nr:hypothetical protein [Verrucomicrobiota bacterium]